MLQYLKLNYADDWKSALYASLDSVYFTQHTLIELAEQFYCSRNADYTVDNRYTLEVGGKSKDGKQIAASDNAFIAADDIDYSVGNKIPLWAFGFLY